MSENIIKISVIDEKLRIEISLDDLKFTEKHGNPAYEITDHKAFVEYLEKYFAETDYSEDSGLTGLQKLIDRFFDNAYESAEEWLHSPFLDEMQYGEQDEEELGGESE